MAASCNGESFRLLRQVYNTNYYAYIGLNHSDEHVLWADVLTRCFPVHLLRVESCLQSSDKCVKVQAHVTLPVKCF
jgi:hypothetical protein